MKKKHVIFLISIFYSLCILSQTSNGIYDSYKVNYYTVHDGLSNNKVNAICKDSDGFIWFGTNEGLNRYDGYKTITYKNDKSDSSSISHNLIRKIITDSNGQLWIGTDDGINVYNPDNNCFRRIPIGKDQHKLNFVWDIIEDKSGTIWLAMHHGIYYKKKDSTKFIAFEKINNLVEDPVFMSVYIDSRNNLWAGTRKHGVLLYSFNSGKSKQFANNPDDRTSISGNWIEAIYEDRNGNIWIGTDKNGLNLFNYENSSFYKISIDENASISIRTIAEDKSGRLWLGSDLGLFLKESDSNSFIHFAHVNDMFKQLNHNSINDLYIDNIDIIWIATFAGGVNYIDMNQKKFVHYSLNSNSNQSLNSSTVYTIFEDNKNNLWIGTGSGGINYYNRITKTYEYILNDPLDENSLSGNNVKVILEDKSGNYWIGTNKHGLNYYNIKKNTFKHFRANDQTSLRLPKDDVYDLLIDSKENLWIATAEGLGLMPKERNKIIHLSSKEDTKHLFKGDITSTVYEDSYKNIWIGTYNHGLLLFNKADSSFIPFRGDVISGIVYSVFEDIKNKLWIGNSDGLFYLDLQQDSVIHYTEKDGLPVNRVFRTFDDNNGNLWMSTTAGLSKFINGVNTPHIPEFRNYTVEDGLQSKQFVYNSHDISPSGKIYFGGINGFNAFNPDEIDNNPYKASAVITGLKIFNNDVDIGKEIEGKTVLKKSIFKTDELVLSHKHYVFTFEFTSLHYAQPNKNKYAYRLEGFDPENSEWNYTSAENRHATYTNLPGGEYIFKVKATNNDGIWNENPTTLKIIILPPWWKTTWFKILAILTAIGIFLVIYFYRISILKKQQIKLERLVQAKTADLSEANRLLQESQQNIEEQAEELMVQKEDLIDANKNLQELNSTKDKLFSIIAHDIKNPFQSILGFSELLLTRYESLEDEKRLKFVQSIYDSALTIFKLLENLLQWSRAQTKSIQFKPTKFYINDIINDNVLLFQENINSKEIEILLDNKEEIEVYADRNMINTVLRNILSNAIKFTGINGKIYISYTQKNDEVEICIRDTGLGMEQEDIQNLFTVDHNLVHAGTEGEKGTGLGLLISKEFIENHSGKIWAKSELEKGSSFFFTIPNHK